MIAGFESPTANGLISVLITSTSNTLIGAVLAPKSDGDCLGVASGNRCEYNLPSRGFGHQIMQTGAGS